MAVMDDCEGRRSGPSWQGAAASNQESPAFAFLTVYVARQTHGLLIANMRHPEEWVLATAISRPR